MASFSSLKYKHVKHCSTHPKFLHSNSTSHRWAFGAIAELIDNAIDPDVNASQFCIDLKEFNNEPCLVLMDNGCGLNPERLHKMLSFGHSKKQLTPGDKSIGKHGNGFKSGTMRLGKDVLVLTKCATSMTAGFLSQTFLADVGAEDILIPLVSWELKGNRLSPKHADIEESLQAICTYSIFPDEASILAQLDAIPGTGTILIISNLRRHEGILEMDYKSDPHDIRITSEITNSHYQQLRPNQPHTTDVPSDYSLRAYVSILYKVPRMQIFIRDNKVKTKRISGILSQKVTETYKPMGVSEPVKIEMGFNTENRNLYGMMLYHRNRLIKPYMRVGMQLEENERGMGVLGIVEAEFLQPTHNKQDFDDTTAYRRLLKKLSDVLAEYWWEKKERVTLSLPQPEIPAKRSLESDSIDEDVPDVVWVQCDNPSCLKWRVLPEGTDPTSLPDSWYCEYHPDPKYRKHEEAEQEWDASIQHEIVERRKERKREYDRERKEKEAHRRRQRLEVIVSREEQMAMQRQREAFRKEIEERKTKDIAAIEQERKAREDEVQRLQKELNDMQAKRDEIQEQHNELLKRLESDDGKKTSITNKKPADDNHVQFSEHEMSQVGVSGSEDLSEERPVDSQKNDDACSIRQNDVPQIQWKEAELNRAPLDEAVTHSTNHRIKSLQERYQDRQETHHLTPSVEDEAARDVYQHHQDAHQTKKVEDEGYQHRQATYFSIQNNDDVQKEARDSYEHQQQIRFPGRRTKDSEVEAGHGYRQDTSYNSRDMQDEAGQSYQHQQSTQFLEERNKDDDGHCFQHQLDGRFPNKRNKTLDHELAYQHRQDPPQVFEQQFGTQSVAISGPGRHFEEHRAQIQIMESTSEILDPSSNQLDSGHNQSKVNEHSHYRGSKAYPSDVVGISMATGAGAAAPTPMPQHVLQDCLPGFASSFPHAHQSKQPTRAPSEHVNHGNTLGPLSSFQNVHMPQSEGSRSMYQDGSRPMLPRSENQHHVQYPALPSVALNNDVQSRLTNGTFSESLSLCSDSMLVPRVDSSGGMQRREGESSLILSLQGRLRMVLKTLLKIAGPLEAQIDVDEILLSDLEVVTICEKAKALVGMRWQAYEQEISKLKAELAYTMADKLQIGQNFRIRGLAGDTWD